MGNAGKPLRFELLPCPRCGTRLTVDDIRQTGESTWAIQHTCNLKPLFPGSLTYHGNGAYCTGENLRMAAQEWNKYARERNL